jgi:hypothetical protein
MGRLTVTPLNTYGQGSASMVINEYVRLLLYGGARKSSDNSAFYYASLNVKKDYNNDGKIILSSVDTAKKIIDTIAEQRDNSIQSLDFFSHGGPGGLFFIKGSSTNNDLSSEEVEEQNLNSSLYVGRLVKTFYGSDKNNDSRIVQQIPFEKFTRNCKIEMHGCQTCYDMTVLDNMCEELSELLYSAGKTDSVVIGHAGKANPNINGTSTTIAGQDYRHGKRCVFNNGKEIWSTNKSGRITAAEINAALQSR